MSFVVAEITKDHTYIPEEDVNQVGRQFEYQAVLDWWGWNDLPDLDGWIPKEETPFKLYDDDGELYYEGWLKNDDECIVQQFVLAWAQADSGCTTIKVQTGEKEFVQIIG